MSVDEMDLGLAYQRLVASFPKGMKKKSWLNQRDRAHKMLSALWAEARNKDKTSVSVPMQLLEAHLDLMRQCDSQE